MQSQSLLSRRAIIKGIGYAAAATFSGNFISAIKAEEKSRSTYNVFSPGKIGNLDIKNRIIKAATATQATLDDGRFLHEGYDIYRDWSKGGAGLIITGHMTVVPIPEMPSHSQNKMSHSYAFSHQTCIAFPHNLDRIYDDAYIPQIRKIADVIHAADPKCKTIVQLNHIGNHPLMRVEGVGPSSQPWPGQKRKPRPLSINEIHKITDAFADSALRAKKAGFDGVELHAAHSFLLHSFLSPLTNLRTDEYGGSIKNRVKIVKETVQKIKKIAGSEFPVLIKANAYDKDTGGIDINNFPQLAAEIASTGIDAIELSGGKPALSGIDDPEKQSYHAKYAKKLNIDIPVILTGGNKSVDVIERLFQPGKIDFFGFARPLIKEPDLPNRWLINNANAVCKCISCNNCIRYYACDGHKLLRCVQL